MFDLGPEKLLIILLIVLILFGGTKIPQLMKGLGEGMKEFRKATHDDVPENSDPEIKSLSHKA
ncbi:MAG: twin-arginine translocase TatA/TatE family subunit [Abditibacteriaceae bacterium]